MNPVPIPLSNGRIGWIHAGPTRDCPPDLKLVACAVEIPVPEHRIAYDLKTPDFTHLPDAKVERVIPEILADLEAGVGDLYIGCMGGTGRTGTALALLVASHPDMDGPTAVEYVRAVYKRGAVETAAQHRQVEAWGRTPRETVPEAKPVHVRAPLLSRIWNWLNGG